MKQWYYCPVCGQKLLMVEPSKKFEGVYIKCKRCRQEVEIVNEPKPEPAVKTAL